MANILDISFPNGIDGGDGGSGGSGSSTGGGNSTYSNLSGDFTATANAGGKTITLSAFAGSVLSAALSRRNFSVAVIKRINAAGVVDTLPVTNIAYADGVLTLADMAANFAAGDTVAVLVPGPDKGFDEAGDYQKSSLASKLAGEDLDADVIKTERRGSSIAINTATTTVVKNGSGHLNVLRVIGGTLGAVTVYDNTAASGTVLCPTVTPVQNGVLLEDVSFTTGLTIVTAAATVVTGSYR